MTGEQPNRHRDELQHADAELTEREKRKLQKMEELFNQMEFDNTLSGKTLVGSAGQKSSSASAEAIRPNVFDHLDEDPSPGLENKDVKDD
ncbi:hypothetical protein BU16DRAFT_559253 [Lophium mytilinum]|uniref:Uncharacterized protein n=1 Tax=Lophium mytilinum TaxID=390894 RepID=A0A6A6QZI2_9PEZI|nr:hypothetical protein BU16DRAFT_559253 [Lophium mytilinum]